eukprot:scaffold48389_cov40-Phaeocystis_antarctica.AAC.1
MPRAMAAHEPKGGRSLPLRPVHGQVPRCAEPRAAECTAPGRAHGWPGNKLHLVHARLGVGRPGQARRGRAAVPRGAGGVSRDSRQPASEHARHHQQPRHAVAEEGRPRLR